MTRCDDALLAGGSLCGCADTHTRRAAAMRKRDEHAGKRLCPGLSPGQASSKPDGTPEHWVAANRFNRRKRKTGPAPDDFVWHYDPQCKTCQQTIRVDNRNDDVATSLVLSFASRSASRAHVPRAFMLDEMNHRRLVPDVDATLIHGCHGCGESVTRDELEFDHILPLRHDVDFARHHVDNIRPKCRNCNRFKSDKDFSRCLDENEDARQAAHADRAGAIIDVVEDEAPPTLSWHADVAAAGDTAECQMTSSGIFVRCPSVKRKLHYQRPGTLRRPDSSWQCVLHVGHDGPHRADPSAHQAPWYDEPTLDLD